MDKNSPAEDTAPSASGTPAEEELAPEASSDTADVVYVKDRPLLKLIRNVVIGIVATVVILFMLGFVLRLVGIRPPSVDTDIIQNQWDKVTGQTTPTPEPTDDLGELTPLP